MTAHSWRTALRRFAVPCLAALLVCEVHVATSPAADVFWNGGTGNWNTGSSWIGGAIPTTSDKGVVDKGGTAQVTADAAVAMVQAGGAGGDGTVTITGGNFISRGIGGEGVAINGSMNFGPVGGGKGTLNIQGGSAEFGEPAAPGTAVGGDHGWAYIGGSGGNIDEVGGSGSGEFNLSGGTATFHQRIMLGYRGEGVLNQTGGTLIAHGDNQYEDAIGVGDQLGGHGVYNLSGGTAEFTGFMRVGNWEGNGEMYVSNDAQMTVHGELSVGSEAGNAGNTGLFVQSGGDVTVTNLLMAQDAGSTGTYRMSGGTLYVENVAEIGRGGPAEFVQTGGRVDLFNPVIAVNPTSTATYELSGGTLDLAGSTLALGAGVGVFDFQGGELRDTGTVAFSLTNAGGAISPGNGVGSIAITGDYTVTSIDAALNIELSSTASFDKLTATGAVDLDGILNVTLLGGFNPALGNSFTILSGESVTGTFSDLNFPSLAAGLGWDVNYGPTGVSISVVEQSDVLGDTDGDGDVDLDDLNNVRNNFGSAGDPILGDTAPFDGDVDLDDLNAVRNNFGNSGSGSVPEPATWVLLVISTGTFLAARRRKRS